jgi:hypothetical protein
MYGPPLIRKLPSSVKNRPRQCIRPLSEAVTASGHDGKPRGSVLIRSPVVRSTVFAEQADPPVDCSIIDDMLLADVGVHHGRRCAVA